MKPSLVLILLLSLTASCFQDQPEGYTSLANNISIRRHTVGEGDYYPRPLDYVAVKVLFPRPEDVPQKLKDQWEGVKTFQLDYSVKQGGMGYAITRLAEGDSATFLIPLDQLTDTTADKRIRVNIILLNVSSPDDFEARMREINAWEAELDRMEFMQLKEFLDKNHPGAEPQPGGWYYVEQHTGSGKLPADGDLVRLHYRMSLTDGTELYNTWDGVEPLEFTWGAESQLVPGLILGVRRMREGGKSRIIVPSHLAFGKKGSSTGLVPPDATLIFDTELISIK